MKQANLEFCLALTATVLLPVSHGIEIAFDMVNSNSMNLNAFTNPHEDIFSSNQDGFRKYIKGGPVVIPNALRDDGGNDMYGILLNDEEFFGVADTISNGNEDPLTAEWDFNVTGYDNIEVSIDMAAMGNFEDRSSGLDYFKWFARFDGQPLEEAQEIFSAQCDRSDSLSYTLASSNINTLDDPLKINCCGIDAIPLNNAFQTLTSPVSGTGASLKLTLEARTNGGNEGIAFQNIMVSSEDWVCSPDQFCQNEQVTTMTPETCLPAGLTATTLNSFAYNNDTLIELLGPADPANAAAIVISVAHGGSLKPGYIPDRSVNNDTYCPGSGCRVSKDSYTLEIALALKDKIIANYCKVPYVIINHLHRSKLDANREVGEAAHGDPVAEDAWLAFHGFISDAQTLVKAEKGTVPGSTGLSGVRGLLFDIHGYGGTDWVDPQGSPFIQWGYRLSSTSLDPNHYCPLDTRSTGAAGSFSHARFIPPESTNPDSRLECLVRGPGSLGSRVQPLFESCGAGLPSANYPNPAALANDCAVCQDACSDPPESCTFYSGGYDIDVHEFLDWQNKAGDYFNGVQAELPRCIRFNSTTHEAIANALSISICSFLRDLFGAAAGTC